MQTIKENTNRQSGQALLFVVVAMTIALTVGIAITSRTVTSLRRTSSTDTAARVFAAAEGGIEWFLRQPLEVLQNLSDGDTQGGADCPNGTTADPNNPAACVVTYLPQTNETRGQDEVQTKSVVTISLFRVNNTTDNYYWFNLEPGDVKEVQLRNFQSGSDYYNGDIDICWKSLSPTQSSAVYFYTLQETGINEKVLLNPQGPTIGTINVTGATDASGGRLEFTSCYTANISGNTLALRLRSLYAPSKIGVFPADAGSFPYQGYKITSLGQLDSAAELVTQKKEISAYRSLPYAAGIFDSAIYSDAAID